MKISFLVLLVLLSCAVVAQDYKFGVISADELKEERDPLFKDTNAKVIYRKVDFEYGKVLYVSERIKIYNKEGFEYGKWEINFDDVEALKAYTYNLENGQIIETKVGKESIFKEDVGDGEEVSKIVFPNVRAGSVLEIKYKVRDLGLRSINTQSYIPIKHIEILVKNPYSRSLKITENLLSNVKLNVIEKPYEIRYSGVNIKAFKKEKYITSTNTFQGKLYIELASRYGNNKLSSWKDVATVYNDALWFGQELRKSGFYKKDLEYVLGNETDPLEKAKKIYYYLQDRMTWNEEYGRGSENIRKAYNDKTGAVGDINLTLTSMLRKAGLSANPFLVATKNRGYILFPTAVGFNCTITALELDNEIYLLDASNKNAGFGELRNAFSNGKGLIVYNNDNFKTHNTNPEKQSRDIYMVNAAINPQTLEVTGVVKNRKDGYISYNFRNDYNNKVKGAYFSDLREDHNQLETSNFEIKDQSDVQKPITLSYEFSQRDYAEDINGNIYFSPLFLYGLVENEFNEEARVYPFDFKYPTSKTYTINYEIPEGYKINSLPKAKNIILQDDIANLIFEAKTVGNNLQVSFRFNINYAIIGADYYEGFKRLFSEYFEVSQSKIVLSKI